MKPLEHIIIENGHTDCIEEAIEIIKDMIEQWKDGVHVYAIFREYNIPAAYHNAFYQYDYLIDEDDEYGHDNNMLG